MTAIDERSEPGSWVGPVEQHDSQALATSGVAKASPAVFYEINGYNDSASLRYVHVYNSATVPTDGAVPACVPVAVPPKGVFSLALAHGMFCSAGLSWASSTTLQTKTESGVADVWATVTYK